MYRNQLSKEKEHFLGGFDWSPLFVQLKLGSSDITAIYLPE